MRALALCLLLAACQAPVTSACPPIPTWSEADALALADELDALTGFPLTERAVVEYAILRDQIRACR